MTGHADRGIRLFHYEASPYAQKIVLYLALRQLPYAEVKQPMIMPRPDLAAIGVAYRRIPVMAIGRDVYCDTRIILRKLEEFFPEGKLGTSTPETIAIQKLLEIWHVEGPLFPHGVGSMPSSHFSHPKFVKDREQLLGKPFDLQGRESRRPESHAYIQGAFELFEDLLADGRQWLVGTQRPSWTDLEAVFMVSWLLNSKKALPEDLFSPARYPKTRAWISRFDNVVAVSKAQGPKPIKLDGATSTKEILASDYAEPAPGIQESEPLKWLSVEDQVEVFPTDNGMFNKDKGRLVGLTYNEIVIELDNHVRVHYPRAGYRVRVVGSNM